MLRWDVASRQPHAVRSWTHPWPWWRAASGGPASTRWNGWRRFGDAAGIRIAGRRGDSYGIPRGMVGEYMWIGGVVTRIAASGRRSCSPTLRALLYFHPCTALAPAEGTDPVTTLGVEPTDRAGPPRPRCRQLMGVRVLGTGSYVPDAVVTHAYAAVIDRRFLSRHTLWHARGMARFVRKHPERLLAL